MLSEFLYFFQGVLTLIVIFLVIVQPSKQNGLGSMSGGSDEESSDDKIPAITKITGFFIILFVVSTFSIIYTDSRQNIERIETERTLDI
jgi:protein translocase SecG subunit